MENKGYISEDMHQSVISKLQDTHVKICMYLCFVIFALVVSTGVLIYSFLNIDMTIEREVVKLDNGGIYTNMQKEGQYAIGSMTDNATAPITTSTTYNGVTDEKNK